MCHKAKIIQIVKKNRKLCNWPCVWGVSLLCVCVCSQSSFFTDFVFVKYPTCYNLFVTPKLIDCILWACAELWEIWVPQSLRFRLRCQTRWHPVFLFQLSCCKQVPFCMLFFAFGDFLLAILLFMMGAKHSDSKNHKWLKVGELYGSELSQ